MSHLIRIDLFDIKGIEEIYGLKPFQMHKLDLEGKE